MLLTYRPAYRPTFRADWKRVISARRWWILAAFVSASLAAAALGTALAAVAAGSGWYAGLRMPLWMPPEWLIGVPCLAAYALASVSAWRVWLSPHSNERRRSLQLYALQSVLSALWLPLFFGLRSPSAALLDLTLLLATLLWMQPRFRRVQWTAASLLTPYLVSVAGALLLNLSIVNMN